jgi:hypothetical protein
MEASIITQNQPIRGLFTLNTMERVDGNNIMGVGVKTITPFYAGNFVYETESMNYPMPLEMGKTWDRIGEYRADSVFADLGTLQFYLDIMIRDSSHIEVDAEGELTIPAGTFPCLRLKIYRYLSVDVYLANTTTLVYSSPEDVIMYEWHTQDGGMLLQVSSHSGETDPNYTDAGLVVRMQENNVLTGVDCDPDCDNPSLTPDRFSLKQNYPNPFNPSTSVSFTLAEPSRVHLSVLNLLGQEIALLESGIRQKGSHSIQWNGRDFQDRNLPAGIYFYRLRAVPVKGGEAFVQTRKMIMAQ